MLVIAGITCGIEIKKNVINNLIGNLNKYNIDIKVISEKLKLIENEIEWKKISEIEKQVKSQYKVSDVLESIHLLKS